MRDDELKPLDEMMPAEVFDLLPIKTRDHIVFISKQMRKYRDRPCRCELCEAWPVLAQILTSETHWEYGQRRWRNDGLEPGYSLNSREYVSTRYIEPGDIVNMRRRAPGGWHDIEPRTFKFNDKRG